MPRTPQVPGAQPDVQAPAADDSQQSAPVAQPDVQAQPEDTVAVPKAQLDALLARLDRLESAQQSPAARVANAQANLPSQDDVDPSKIDRAVLTKDGWVVPVKQLPPAARSL